VVFAKTLFLVQENLPAPALHATKSPVPSVQDINIPKDQIFNLEKHKPIMKKIKQNTKTPKKRQERKREKKKEKEKDLRKDLGLRGLLVHVDVFPRQEFLVAEKALVKESGSRGRRMEVFTGGSWRQRRRGFAEKHVGFVDNLRDLLANATLLGFQHYTQSCHISHPPLYSLCSPFHIEAMAETGDRRLERVFG
jgi:hypothetical protein